jgi:hypothetical protein
MRTLFFALFFTTTLQASSNSQITLDRKFVKFLSSDGHPVTTLFLHRSIQIGKYQFKLFGSGVSAVVVPGSLATPQLEGRRAYFYEHMDNSVVSPHNKDTDFLGEVERDYYVLDRFSLENSIKWGKNLYKPNSLKISISYKFANSQLNKRLNKVEFYSESGGELKPCSNVLSYNFDKDFVDVYTYMNSVLPNKVVCKSNLSKKQLQKEHLNGMLKHYLAVARWNQLSPFNTEGFSRDQLKQIVEGINNKTINIGSDIERNRPVPVAMFENLIGLNLHHENILEDKAAGLAYEEIYQDLQPRARLTINNEIVFEYND